MIPENPSPNAAATVNRPASFCVNRNAVIDADCHAEPINTVARPPMRSEMAPQICRLKNAVPSSTDSIKRAVRAADAEVAAKGDEMALRHRHRNAAQHRCGAHHAENQIGRPSEHARFSGGGIGRCGRENEFRRRAKINQRQRNDHNDLGERVPKHRVAPAERRRWRARTQAATSHRRDSCRSRSSANAEPRRRSNQRLT